ncbi:ATP-binding protein [Exilibacterium tricleocarpae]|uniref:ATP-binding protein n=1 Tax=Exilibacterium tricleocarpae TaxID=2591008 RepID=A0A545T5S9_9GAMM|nr:ATP-binding protein [Exilibacterium tricleocarpae]TQV72574.1 ATP-binding protein [Exilibacterium tricleocarpae]
MTAVARESQNNFYYLGAALDQLRNHMRRYLGQAAPASVLPRCSPDAPPALERLCHQFGLDTFERELLLLCAGVSLDGEFAELCAAARGDSHKHWVSFDLALQVFNDGQWRPFSTHSSLRYWLLLRLEDPANPQLSALHIDEGILHYLTGHVARDPQVTPLCLPLAPPAPLIDSHQQIADRIARVLADTPGQQPGPLIQITGSQAVAGAAVVQQAFHTLEVQCYRIDAQSLPRELQALHKLFLRLEREALLYRVGYLFEAHYDSDQADTSCSLDYLLKRLTAPCAIARENPLQIPGREILTFAIGRPSYPEQAQLWRQALAGDAQAKDLQDCWPRLPDQFDLSEQQIRTVVRQWRAGDGIAQCDDTGERLWSLCRQHTRQQIGAMVRVIEPAGTDPAALVLPAEEKQIIDAIRQQVLYRHQVYRQWGFAGSGAQGLGISALFAGSSGTGKTLAASVIAADLGLDIYHVDLSAAVSKYIGETEKNLEKIFSAAENSGAILLFDEADALFGKRSQVNDSKDRYANMEVSYLLQRMESYSGLSILTSNYKNHLDDAFRRRLRFIVQFPFPQAAQRRQIWRQVFPNRTPVGELDYEKLSRLEIPGGIIRNIAVSAAFYASGDSCPVGMAHILQAVRDEYRKSEKTLQTNLIAGW